MSASTIVIIVLTHILVAVGGFISGMIWGRKALSKVPQ